MKYLNNRVDERLKDYRKRCMDNKVDEELNDEITL